MSFRVGNPPPRPPRAHSSQAPVARGSVRAVAGRGGSGVRSHHRLPDPDAGRLESLNKTLQRLHGRIERKISEYRNESEGTEALIERAQRLNGRMEVLKEKLRMCFRLSGEQSPANLQVVLQQMAESEDPEDAPPEFVCPITQCVMIDPVQTCDGQVYDRCAIVEWFANFPLGQAPTSPLTNLQLENVCLVPREDVRVQIKNFLAQKNGGVVEETAPKSIEFRRAQPEEPSRRALPGPIWGSSVVPTSEENSRVLNMIRVDDTFDTDGFGSMVQGTGVSATMEPSPAQGRGAARSRGSNNARVGRGPIWGSSVVPPQEPNSRVLNTLRMDDTIEIPDAAPPTTAPAAAPSAPAPSGGRAVGTRVLPNRLQRSSSSTVASGRRALGQQRSSPAPSALPPANTAASAAGRSVVPQHAMSLNLNSRRSGRSVQ